MPSFHGQVWSSGADGTCMLCMLSDILLGRLSATFAQLHLLPALPQLTTLRHIRDPLCYLVSKILLLLSTAVNLWPSA